MTARLPNLNSILRRHKIDRKFWPEFRGMVEEFRLPSKELWSRMNREANYEAARNEIAHALSGESENPFPPDDYQAPADYQFYESPNPESIGLASSGGCAV